MGTTRVRAIATPGFTPGSMSYLVNEAILFTGDTFRLSEGKVLSPFYRFLNMDTEQQKESIRKLASLKQVKMACTAHTKYTSDWIKAISHQSESKKMGEG